MDAIIDQIGYGMIPIIGLEKVETICRCLKKIRKQFSAQISCKKVSTHNYCNGEKLSNGIWKPKSTQWAVENNLHMQTNDFARGERISY
jgi:hypothetical protein